MPRVEIQEVVVNSKGSPLSGISVEVRRRLNSALATVYTAETGATTKVNPLTTDANGRIEGWVEPDSYNLVVSGAAITSYTQPYEAATGLPGEDALRRSSEVATITRTLASSTGSFGSGFVVGNPAWARSAGTFANITCACATVGTVTDIRAGVWADDGTKLGETGNFSASLVANTVLTIPLLAAVTVTAGQKVVLGIGSVNTATPSFRGANVGVAAILGRSTRLVRLASGYAGGVLPTLPDTGLSAAVIWMELDA